MFSCVVVVVVVGGAAVFGDVNFFVVSRFAPRRISRMRRFGWLPLDRCWSRAWLSSAWGGRRCVQFAMQGYVHVFVFVDHVDGPVPGTCSQTQIRVHVHLVSFALNRL